VSCTHKMEDFDPNEEVITCTACWTQVDHVTPYNRLTSWNDFYRVHRMNEICNIHMCMKCVYQWCTNVRGANPNRFPCPGCNASKIIPFDAFIRIRAASGSYPENVPVSQGFRRRLDAPLDRARRRVDAPQNRRNNEAPPMPQPPGVNVPHREEQVLPEGPVVLQPHPRVVGEAPIRRPQEPVQPPHIEPATPLRVGPPREYERVARVQILNPSTFWTENQKFHYLMLFVLLVSSTLLLSPIFDIATEVTKVISQSHTYLAYMLLNFIVIVAYVIYHFGRRRPRRLEQMEGIPTRDVTHYDLLRSANDYISSYYQTISEVDIYPVCAEYLIDRLGAGTSSPDMARVVFTTWNAPTTPFGFTPNPTIRHNTILYVCQTIDIMRRREEVMLGSRPRGIPYMRM